jgi:hypothetical protein
MIYNELMQKCVVYQCNRLCGEGMQKRQVRCFRRVEGKIEVLGDSACPGEKPEEDKPCELRPCEGVDWVVSDWSGVSDIITSNRSHFVHNLSFSKWWL